MSDWVNLGYLGYPKGFILSEGIALRILGYLGYLTEGDGYQGLLPGVPGVPEGGQVTVVIQHGWSQTIVIPGFHKKRGNFVMDQIEKIQLSIFLITYKRKNWRKLYISRKLGRLPMRRFTKVDVTRGSLSQRWLQV